MHNDLHSLRMGIAGQFLNIKIRIRCHKVEHVFLPLSKPVFPTRVPTFYQHALNSVFGSKIYISFYVCSISSVWHLRRLLRANLPATVVPTGFTYMHFPPHSYHLLWSNP